LVGRFVPRVLTTGNPNRLPPDIHNYTSSKPPRIVLPLGIPAVEEYYDRNDSWSEESLARRRAVLG